MTHQLNFVVFWLFGYRLNLKQRVRMVINKTENDENNTFWLIWLVKIN